MEVTFAILKLVFAFPVIVAFAIGVGAILNLLFDPDPCDQPGFLERQAVPMGSALLLAMFLFLLAAQFWVPLLIPLDESLSHSHPLRLMRSSVGLVATCLFLGVLTRRWPKALPLSFYRRPIMAYAIFLPLLALVAFFNRILVEDVLGREIPFELFEGFLELQGTPLFLAAVLLVIFVPWFEEILFRNYLWGAMVKNPGFGIVRSLLFTSLAFAVLHPPTVWLPVFCLGFFLGWVRWRSGRLSEAVLLHQLHNLVVLLLFFPINS